MGPVLDDRRRVVPKHTVTFNAWILTLRDARCENPSERREPHNPRRGIEQQIG